jgi:hypothetical protein
MPTLLQKQIHRELAREGLIVRVSPEGIYTREKRSRRWWGPIPWSKVHWQCQQVQVHEAIADQDAKKALRRATR